MTMLFLVIVVSASSSSSSIDNQANFLMAVEDSRINRSHFTRPTTPPPTPRPDVCHEICIEFQSNRRGNGYNLCEESRMSRCLYQDPEHVCEYLYWSVTEDGVPGLVYITNTTDSSDTELSRPLTCPEAQNIIYNQPSLVS